MSAVSKNSYTKVLYFWFNELSPQDWWTKSLELDLKIKKRFGLTHKQAINGELSPWRENALGRLAEIIVIDQFSRNIYRDTPQAFSSDQQALALAQEMIAQGLDKSLPQAMRSFAYLPFMHSESKLIHKEAVRLYKEFGDEYTLGFEYKHKEIIDRFGRYPHRNIILGRVSTPEEIEFLKEDGSSF